jgi:copper chaperone CopZ
MTCHHCRTAVERAIKAIDGVQAAAADLEAKTATVTFDPAKTKPEAFNEAVARAGYAVVEGGER